MPRITAQISNNARTIRALFSFLIRDTRRVAPGIGFGGFRPGLFRLHWTACLALLMLFHPAASVQAQSSRGTITGLVTDSSGGTLANTSVVAVNAAASVRYQTVTNEAGNYSIQQLPEGEYKVTVEKTGFKASVNQNVQLSLGQTRTLNVSLQLGNITQTVEVASNAAQVQTSTSELATAVTRQLVIDLPLSVSGNMRNPESFTFLTPGVTGTTGNTEINGSQSRAKEVLVDGIASTGAESGDTLLSYPSVEAISEFQLLGADFNAEYGRTGGGFEIFTTRSGTNQFHGSVFDYLRNNIFDARGFFSPVTPVNRQNEYGVVLGGPVWIPKVYNGKDRTFFHFVYSGFRYRQGNANTLIAFPQPLFGREIFPAWSIPPASRSSSTIRQQPTS